jgi:NADH-quinone oxidoreductase subunit F
MTVEVVSKNFKIPNSYKIDVAIDNGRYSSLDKLFSMSCDDVIDEVDKSGLRGKGGGGALAGDKWRLIPKDSDENYLVVNADESEPGTFKDRQILEFDPHLLIEGIICSSYAIRANHSYIYIRGEYKFWAKRLNEAIEEAYSKGYLGKNILNSGFDLDVVVHRGAGAYICGEKTALLESLEGKRGHPRLKPKQKECDWFFAKPTIVNNVETISTVPYILENGYEAYKAMGTEQSSGCMLFGISGNITNAGVYELPFGMKMIDVIEKLGGGIKNGKKLKAVIPGGASCPILTVKEVQEATLDYETMRAMGSALGTGGMIVMDEDTSMVEVAKNLIEFYHHESCGQCTPCREGTSWIDGILNNIINCNCGDLRDIDTIKDICTLMNGKTVCVFAPAVSAIISSIINKFGDEFEEMLRSCQCPA